MRKLGDLVARTKTVRLAMEAESRASSSIIHAGSDKDGLKHRADIRTALKQVLITRAPYFNHIKSGV